MNKSVDAIKQKSNLILIIATVLGLLLILYMAAMRKMDKSTLKNDSDSSEAKDITEETVIDPWQKAMDENNSIELARLSGENRQIIDGTNYEGIDNKLYAWWFKRNDNHEKSGCQEDFDIGQYDAFYTVPVSEKRIFITFDCGYENGYTSDILDVLKEENVTAAFFVTQTFIRDNVELTKRMKEEGHLVCNHTVTHPSMPSKSIEEQKN